MYRRFLEKTLQNACPRNYKNFSMNLHRKVALTNGTNTTTFTLTYAYMNNSAVCEVRSRPCITLSFNIVHNSEIMSQRTELLSTNRDI